MKPDDQKYKPKKNFFLYPLDFIGKYVYFMLT